MIKTPELSRALIAIFLAGALWLIVSAEEPTAEWVPVRVILTLDTAVVLADAPTPVRAFVVGRRRDLFKLLSSPLTLQRAITDDARDSVRIELREQDLDISPSAEISVRDLRPRLITVRLRRASGDLQSAAATSAPVVATPMPSQRAGDAGSHVTPPRDSVRDSTALRKPPV